MHMLSLAAPVKSGMFLAILGAALIQSIQVKAASLIATTPVKLSAADSATLEDTACIQPLKLKAASIQAFKYKGETNAFSYAEINCKPHAELKGAPVFYSHRCAFSDKKWSCESAEFHLLGAINGRTVDIVAPESKANLVYESLQKVSKSYQFVNKIPINEVIGDSCNVSTTNSPDEFDYMCAAYFKLSLWCPQPETSHCPGILSMQNRY